MQTLFKYNLTKILLGFSLTISLFSLPANGVFAQNISQDTIDTPAESSILLAAQCAVDFNIVTDFGTSGRVELVIHNASGADINGWTLGWDFPNDQAITLLNNGVLSQTNANVTVSNDGLNGYIPNGSSITNVSFDYTYSSGNDVPTAFQLNGAPCDNNAYVVPLPYSENFESLSGLLTSAVSETVPSQFLGWTHFSPPSWDIENEASMAQGSAEYQGWSFVSPTFWKKTDPSNHVSYLNDSGVFAVADAGSWSDSGNPAETSEFNSSLSSPLMNVQGLEALRLQFDSHLRPGGEQRAIIGVQFDGGDIVTVQEFNSTNTADDGSQLNQELDLEIAIPDGSETIRLYWTLKQARSDHFWAIDNIQVSPIANLILNTLPEFGTAENNIDGVKVFEFLDIDNDQLSGVGTNQYGQEKVGWRVWEDIIEENPNGDDITWDIGFVNTPSLDGNAFKCEITGGIFPNNIFCAFTVARQTPATPWPFDGVDTIVLDMAFYVDGNINCLDSRDSDTEGIEFYTQYTLAPRDQNYGYALLWQANQHDMWYWTDNTPNWEKVRPGVNLCVTDHEWHQIQIVHELDEDDHWYRKLVFDGQEYDIGSSHEDVFDTFDFWHEYFINVALQVDSKATSTSDNTAKPVAVYIDQVDLVGYDSRYLSIKQDIIGEDPLIGGDVTFEVQVSNDDQTDSQTAHNLSIGDSLPPGMILKSVDPTPSIIIEPEGEPDPNNPAANDPTLLYYLDVADLGPNETFNYSVTATLSDYYIDYILNTDTRGRVEHEVAASSNVAKNDESDQDFIEDLLITSPRFINVSGSVAQSTHHAQAGGAGEFNEDGIATWPVRYSFEIQNNNKYNSEEVKFYTYLPKGIAYLGNVSVSPWLPGSDYTPRIELGSTGAITLSWHIGDLTPDHYSDPIQISFDAAVPYRNRDPLDSSAAVGAFPGPFTGSFISEGDEFEVNYHVTADYDGNTYIDGSLTNSVYDKPLVFNTEYAAYDLSVTPSTLDQAGGTVEYLHQLKFSEYYDSKAVEIEQIIPRGVDYANSSLLPSIIEGIQGGETRIVWDVPQIKSEASDTFTVTLEVIVTKNAADIVGSTGTVTGHWGDFIADDGFLYPLNTKTDTVFLDAGLTNISQQVQDSSGVWKDSAVGFSSDEIDFNLHYEQAETIGGRDIIVRSVLPHGMFYVDGSDSYTSDGQFGNGSGCTANEDSPNKYVEDGVEVLEWQLCNVGKGSVFDVTFTGIITKTPDVHPDWSVASYGRLEGENQDGVAYSQQVINTIDYQTPSLVITMTGTPKRDVEAGDTIAFEVEVMNQGEAPAYQLELETLMPEWIEVSASGGTSSSGGSSFTADSLAQAGNGGILTWTPIASLGVSETVTYSWSGTVKSGLPVAQSMLGRSSIAYNSHPISIGSQFDRSGLDSDPNTDEVQLFGAGITLEQLFADDQVEIGEIITVTLNGTIPPNFTAYYPVLKNTLPNGVKHIPGTVKVTGATLYSELFYDNRYGIFLDTIVNNTGSPLPYTVTFQAVADGRDYASGEEIFNNNCVNLDPITSIIGWWNSPDGYDHSNGPAFSLQEESYDSFSPIDEDQLTVIQPCLEISVKEFYDVIAAGDLNSFTVTITNTGQSSAFDVEILNTLPVSTTLYNLEYTSSPEPANVVYTTTVKPAEDLSPSSNNVTIENNSAEGEVDPSQEEYWTGVSEIPAGGIWTVKYRVNTSSQVAASMRLVNRAEIIRYTSGSGSSGDRDRNGQIDSLFDNNGDGLNDLIDAANVNLEWSDHDLLANPYDANSYYLTLPDISVPHSLDTSSDADGDGVVNAADLDDDNDGIPDLIECSFEADGTLNSIINGGFEFPVIPIEGSDQFYGSLVPGWSSNSTSGEIELFGTNFEAIPAYQGRQFAEINASDLGTLYFDIATVPGDTLNWSFAHRGRFGTDSLRLEFGPIDSTANSSQAITSGFGEWKIYSGTYLVPAGQTMTRMGFTAISTAGGATAGNLLDAVTLTGTTCNGDVDQDGLPNHLDLDSDGDGIYDMAESGGIDFSSDGFPDDRAYSGEKGSALVLTDGISIYNIVKVPDEVTYGSVFTYSLTIPGIETWQRVRATMYDAVVTDHIDNRLDILSITDGTLDGNTYTINYGDIPPETVKNEEIVVQVPLNSSIQDGDQIGNQVLFNTAQDRVYADAVQVESGRQPDTRAMLFGGNPVEITAPALVVETFASSYGVSVGDQFTVTLRVKNVGRGTANNVNLSATFPANISLVGSSATSWSLGAIAGQTYQDISVVLNVDSVEFGRKYPIVASANGEDILGNLIPADNSGRVPADNNPTDIGETTIFAGGLNCETTTKNVAFEDLKNVGYNDWDFNDLVVRLDSELCYAAGLRAFEQAHGKVDSTQLRAPNACADSSLEAELATLTGFTVTNDGSVSNGQYISVPGSGNARTTPDESEKAVFTFNVAEGGTFSLDALVSAPSRFSNAFFVKINDGEPFEWWFNPTDGTWFTSEINQSTVDSNPYEFELTAGTHTITIYGNEQGTRLDKLSLICNSFGDALPVDSLATATLTYTVLARGAGFQHTLLQDMQLAGTGQARAEYFDGNGQFVGSEAFSFYQDTVFEIFSNTRSALPVYFPEDHRPHTNSRPEQTEHINGSSVVLRLILNDPAENLKSDLNPAPWDLYIKVLDTTEEIHLPGPGNVDNKQRVLANFDRNAPLVGHHLDMGFIFDEAWTWPFDNIGIWYAYPNFVDFISSGETQYLDWYNTINDSQVWHYGSPDRIPEDFVAPKALPSRFNTSPVIADLDLDGNYEIIIGDAIDERVKVYNHFLDFRWSFSTDQGADSIDNILADVKVANLDADPELEILFGTESGWLYAINHDGTLVGQFPQQISIEPILSTPEVVDLDGDGIDEILIGSGNGRIYVRHLDGSYKWNTSLGDFGDQFGNQAQNSGAVAADLDEDDDLEIIIGSWDHSLYVLDHEENLLWTYPTQDVIIGSALVAELDPEHVGPEIAFGSGDGNFYMLNASGQLIWKRQINGIILSSPSLYDLDQDGSEDLLIGGTNGLLYAWSTAGDLLDGYPFNVGGEINGRPLVTDIDTDGVDEIIVGARDGKVYAWELNGQAVVGWPKDTGYAINGSLAVLDVDSHPDMELIAANFGGELHIFETNAEPRMSYLPLTSR